MEDMEQEGIASAPDECKPQLWKRYVDDTLEAIKRGNAEQLKQHMNTIHIPTDSINLHMKKRKKVQLHSWTF